MSMLSHDEGQLAVRYARGVVEATVKGEQVPEVELTPVFDRKAGAFVTLHTYPHRQLRGCIGVPDPVMPLREAICEGARSATCDPRFPPLRREELHEVVVEITVLTPPRRMEASSPEQYVRQVVIGRDGLIAERGPWRGLLLPQVPLEYGWGPEEFLSHTCRKAGLTPDAWRTGEVVFYRFQGEVFGEKKPYGPVARESLEHGC
ncbi:MAG: TIGR00296 family protein [Candidatus Thermoplasmatota archaeon]|nr:TIGR00296 family protein [Candidatus Thermoplasmatota archaeon]